MNFKIKCRCYDNINIYKYNIKIYDNNNHLIINEFTDKLGNYDFKVPYFGLYKIVINNFRLYPNVKCIKIYFDENNCHELVVSFSKCPYIIHPVTINFTDQNYKGLPIEKGKVILWTVNK